MIVHKSKFYIIVILRVRKLFLILKYATWDLAFHMIPFIHLDIEFAKQQLLLFLLDRYMHSSGQVCK